MSAWFGPAPQIVVAHQPVEVEGAGRARVNLVVGHFRLVRQVGAELPAPRAWSAPAASRRAC